jgi:hypothetical protein
MLSEMSLTQKDEFFMILLRDSRIAKFIGPKSRLENQIRVTRGLEKRERGVTL